MECRVTNEAHHRAFFVRYHVSKSNNDVMIDVLCLLTVHLDTISTS